ncbi:MAG: response regulator transcription factor [Bacteroidota bacterium]|nr:response regulator transcription factor [Bacteroidota bacterium]
MKARILFAEDDINLSFVTLDNLEKYGFEVTACTDGAEALKAFAPKRFDICILDVMMPKVDGFTVAKKIREEDKEIPILFLTAKSMKEDRIEGLKLGGDDYITKPFSIEELILRIEVFLKRSRIQDNTGEEETKVFRIGNYLFNSERLHLSINGSSVRLTAKEGELLTLFARNAGNILKREDILNTIWGDDDYFVGRSLDVFISRLRKYLKDDPRIRIENVHGVGFLLECEQ